MYGSGDDVSLKRSHKKSKHHIAEKYKKRKRSNSVDSNNFEKVKKTKSKSVKNDSENEDLDLSKTKKYKQKNKLNMDEISYSGKYNSENDYNDSGIRKNRHGKESKKIRNDDHFFEDQYDTILHEKELKKKLDSNVGDRRRHSNYNSKNKSSNERDSNEEGYSTPVKKSKKESKEKHRPRSKQTFSSKSKRSESNFDDEDQRKEPSERERGSKYTEKSSRKQSRQTPDEDNYESNDDDSLQNGEKTNRASGSEKPLRYWSITRGPVRKNSDSYWNKYSERLNEPPEQPKESRDNVEVGPRYYSTGDRESSKRGKRNEDISRPKISDKKDDRNEERRKENNDAETAGGIENPQPIKKKAVDILTSRTGGAYIPPAKLRMMQESITDKGSAAYQRLAWEALKKSIQGHVNKVNISNIGKILKAIQKENIVRGRGLVCRALITAQAASPTFTNVYAAFVAVLNAKFPKLGELLLKRLVVQFRRGFKRNDKTICITAATFIAHLVNQEVAHEIIALEMLTLLIETPTDDSVEVAIAFLKECGMKLTEVSSKGVLAIFDMLRNILHEGKLEKRVQYMIEVMFQVRKEDFKAHPALIKELDLVEDEDKIQHMITLEENHDPEDILNVFKVDPNYEENEAKYKSLVDIDTDDEEDSEEEGSSGSGDSDEDSDEDEEEGKENTEKKDVIVDRTETNLVALRKTIYLTIQSSLDFEECAHKLLRMELKPGQEIEMAHMFLDCCAEQRTYEKFYGLLSQRFCQINRSYIGPFEETFRDSYATIHRMTNDKLRNVAKLFAHLLYTDAISWDVLSTIRLNEDDTTSSSRIFIKILFLELSEYMGLAKLNQRVKDPSLQTALEGLFPRDNPKHTRFAINFFTSIGLGGLTDELREHLKTQPKPSLVPQLVEGLSSSSSDSSDSSDTSSSSDSDSSSSESSSSDSEDTSKKKKKRKTQPNKKETPKKDTKTKYKKSSPVRKKTVKTR